MTTCIFKTLLNALPKKKAPLRIAINGIQGSGKTSFAKQWVAFLQQQSINAIHITIDGYHNPKAIRYRQGRDSAKGYYEDCYNEQAFVENVLLASQQNKPCYTPAIFDVGKDQSLHLAPTFINQDSLLMIDGAFLLKSIYRPHWDFVIYLHTDDKTARKRGAERDKILLGGFENAEQKFLNRYHNASQYYIDANQPMALANAIIDNTDYDKPLWIKKPI